MSEPEDLRKRLEQLGVSPGLSGLRAKPPEQRPAPARESIEDWVSGRVVETAGGPCFLAEARYSLQHVHGELPLGALLEHTPRLLVALAGDLGSTGFADYVFLDTETTGLAGGTGTYAFLIGLGAFEDGQFVLRQYFMRDIPEEAAALAEVRAVLERRAGLVTFNGRAFDWPLLETRFAMNRQAVPQLAAQHLDLLLPVRRLWRRRLQSCALSSLEAHVLQVNRSDADVPGWAIPGLYRDFIAYGRAEPLRRVFYHNAHDILSLATLAAHLCRAVCEPLQTLEHGEDFFGLGRQLEAEGDLVTAERLYVECLRCQLSAKTRREAALALSRLYKRAGRPERAVALWQGLAEKGDPDASVELAKFYEHRLGDLELARKLAQGALGALQTMRNPDRRRIAEVEHRLQRLEDKQRRGQRGTEASASRGATP